MHKNRSTRPGTAPEASTHSVEERPLSGHEATEAGTRSEALEQIDLGMVAAIHAFQRWIHNLIRDAGFPLLTVMDAVVLDQLKQRANHKRLADICFILNTEDVHVVGYSLRKLAGMGIVDMTRHGKEVTYSIHPDSERRLARLRAEQEQRLLDALASFHIEKEGLTDLARHLHRMSGLYDAAARAAASL